MNNTMEKQEKKTRRVLRPEMTHVACRIKSSLRDDMQKWADDRQLDLSFVLRRCLEIGWPTFLEVNFYGLEMRPKKEFVS